MDDVKEAFKRLFGDMYLSESETALRVFEYGYKAGAAAENELCAKVCEAIYSDPNGNNGDDAYYSRPYLHCAEAIRERMK